MLLQISLILFTPLPFLFFFFFSLSYPVFTPELMMQNYWLAHWQGNRRSTLVLVVIVNYR